uniref:Family with sequence similarity 189 member B n=1 Tax=Neolamprologus brichardi TaxID=32507 RepID=A0A3Q4G9I3_NEOBR
NMPSPSDSSSVASASGSRGWSDSRRGMSGRGPGGARLLLYLGLCHLGLGAMVLAFSFTSMAFTTTPRVRQSCPFWAGFFDLLFSACGLSILSTIICTLSTVTCSIHIFSLDLLHLLAPHRSRSVNPECTTPQDAFLTNIMDFEEFVPPIPPPPYYPPEYTCSSETDAQSITYNGSMESPVPLYPTDCPPPYEAVMGQRAASQVSMCVLVCLGRMKEMERMYKKTGKASYAL